MPVIAEDMNELTLENLWDSPEGHRVLSCIQCGMCAGTCPYGEVMEYPPRRIIGMLKAGELDAVLRSQSLLTCVTCYACMNKCPRGIRLTEVLLPLVKEQTFIQLTDMPAELQKALENTDRYGNPLGESPRKRADWVKTSKVPVRILPTDRKPTDVLWFVECYTAYHPRGQDNCRATARLFHALGVDFAILGHEEKCAGECARLTGETGLFDKLTDYTMKLLGKYKFNRLVTSGAHAYDTFIHQYKPRGLQQDVDHTVTFLASRLDQLKPKLKKKLNYTVTYHDPCALSRHNGLYDEPRKLLAAIPGVKLVEMEHNRENGICCGGGGGGMWLDTYYKAKGYERLSERRIKEAVATGADVLAVACPYEVSRFEDALKTVGGDSKMIVRDVVELLAESLED